MNTYFISGIGTDVGKTLVSAILVEKLGADYWKPVQSGSATDSDTLTVKGLVSNSQSRFHPESISLLAPVSPHEAADLEGVKIKLTDLVKPSVHNTLVIEGAGGLMVPLNRELLMVDLISYFNARLILVCRNYLGSINHTLLSLELVKQRQIPLAGIIFSGTRNKASEEIISTFSDVPVLGFIPQLADINKESIKQSVDLITF